VAAPKRSSAGWFAVVGVLLLALIGAGVFVVLRYGPSEDADDGPAAVSEARGLRDLAQKKVGAFKRTSVKTNKRTKSGVTDALKVRYKRKGGKQLSYDLFACSSPKKSKKTYSSLVKEAKKKLGKQRAVRSTADIQDEDGEKIGELTRFVSDTEIIAWYEPELAALLVGKYDDTVTFLRDCGHCPEWPEGVE